MENGTGDCVHTPCEMNTGKRKMNRQGVIFIVLNEFTDREGVYIAACLNTGVLPGRPAKYTVSTLSNNLSFG
jgi:hypothetical protein